MKLTAGQGGHQGIPMPLWLQGMLESAQAVLLSALLIVLPLAGVWWANGFPDGTSSASVENGTLHLLPLRLTLIPFFLSWRAGRRLARASYTDQLWQALA